MKVKFIKHMTIGPKNSQFEKRSYTVGDTENMAKKTAEYLIKTGWAVDITEDKTNQVEEIETKVMEEKIETKDVVTKPKRRGRPKKTAE